MVFALSQNFLVHLVAVFFAFAVVPGAPQHPVSAPPATTQPAAIHQLRFSLVALDKDKADYELLNDPNNKGEQIRILKEAIVDQTGVASARTIKGYHGNPAVAITLTDSAGEKFLQFTLNHRRRELTLVVDGKAIYSAMIQEGIGKSMEIDGDLTQDACQQITDAINSAIAHPASDATD